MSKSPNNIISIYCPFPSQEEAEKVATALLSENLIACANILPSGLSIYNWQGKAQRESETFVFFKTSAETAPRTIKRIEELHPYDVPAILQFTVNANPEYVKWVDQCMEEEKK